MNRSSSSVVTVPLWALAGTLLAQLGARVVLVEPTVSSSRDKWRNRAKSAAGKQSIVLDRAGHGA